MSTLIFEKSGINREAALFLFENRYYCSSIHCSYYSILQIMKHLLLDYYDWTETEIRNGEQTGRGTHNFLISHLGAEINKDSVVLGRDFRSNILQLKSLRKQSDYDNCRIGSEKAKEAIDLMEVLQGIMKVTHDI